MSYTAHALRSVQYGAISLTALTATATITSVDTAHAVVIPLGWWGGNADGNADSHTARLTLTNATTVTATCGVAPGSALTVRFVVLEFFPRFVKSVQAFTVTATNGFAADNNQAIASVDTTKAWVIHQGESTTDTSGNSQFSTLGSLQLTSAINVAVRAAVNNIVSFAVVEFR